VVELHHKPFRNAAKYAALAAVEQKPKSLAAGRFGFPDGLPGRAAWKNWRRPEPALFAEVAMVAVWDDMDDPC
jgi:hypothetical protein